MKIFVTGATGFVGAHTAMALLDAGHTLRLLVRNKAAAIKYFKKHGYDVTDIVVADMLDTDAVKAAIIGCDAVIHAAAIVDLNPSHAEVTQTTNIQGIDSVLLSACELGISNIIYVSSISAMFDFRVTHIDESCAIVPSRDAYSGSKAQCEKRVRELQQQGYPITITYPSGVIGPDDPKLSESNKAILNMIKLLVPQTTAGLQCVDVRDVANMHRQLIEADLVNPVEDRRYIIGGHFVPWKELGLMMEEAHGSALRRIIVPATLMRGIGIIVDFLRLFMPIAYPLSRESTQMATQSPQFSSAKILNTLEAEFRPREETITATCTWFKQEGLC